LSILVFSVDGVFILGKTGLTACLVHCNICLKFEFFKFANQSRKEFDMRFRSRLNSLTLATRLIDALDGSDFTLADVNAFIRHHDLPLIRELMRGKAKIKVTGHIINCSKKPFVPKGWKVKRHSQGGRWEFDLDRFWLYQSPSQTRGILGRTFLSQHTGVKLLNANVLDYIIEFPWLYGNDWYDKNVYFPGTVYIDENGKEVIRGLYSNGSTLGWCWRATDEIWQKEDFCSSQKMVFARAI
jgi:hypothetical protein